ncbi:MAG TPA: universal stress protein [Chitinophagaceae bacterium]|nr:universal stress protein [Chitinophagaceae bacterium]
MEKVFSNILLPIQLKRNTDNIITRAVNLANCLKCDLHVLCLNSPDFVFKRIFHSKSSRSDIANKKYQLHKLQNKYGPSIRHGSLFTTTFREGNPIKETIDYAVSQNIDMVLLGEGLKKLHLLPLTFRRFADTAHCSILLGNSHSGILNVDKIILPIDQTLPIKRIRVAAFLAQQLQASIHLVCSGQKKIFERNLPYMKKTYQLLKDNTDLTLTCFTSEGMDPGNAVLDYANSVHAGLIITNINKKSSNENFFQRIFSRDHSRLEQTPIMLVE